MGAAKGKGIASLFSKGYVSFGGRQVVIKGQRPSIVRFTKLFVLSIGNEVMRYL